jgi:hypothetical protein
MLLALASGLVAGVSTHNIFYYNVHSYRRIWNSVKSSAALSSRCVAVKDAGTGRAGFAEHRPHVLIENAARQHLSRGFISLCKWIDTFP